MDPNENEQEDKDKKKRASRGRRSDEKRPEQARTRSSEKEKHGVKRKTYKEEVEESDEEEQFSEENTRKSRKTCSSQNSRDAIREQKKLKRAPERATGETITQTTFLNTFAVTPPPTCTCYANNFIDPVPYAFDSLVEAQKSAAYLIDIEKQKSASQTCNAFTILKKIVAGTDKFLVLITSSNHKPVSFHNDDQVDLGTETINVKAFRPEKELMLSEDLNSDKKRAYVFRCCAFCNHDFAGSFRIDTATDREDLKAEAIIRNTGQNNEVSVLGIAVNLEKLADKVQRPCRAIIISKIQPNESANTIKLNQRGWTLHHSEIESYYYAQRHGWEILEMHIDRNCCAVCGPTVAGVPNNLHPLIHLYR